MEGYRSNLSENKVKNRRSRKPEKVKSKINNQKDRSKKAGKVAERLEVKE